MTNKELIARLQKLPPHLPVFLEPNKPPTAYGEIHEVRIDHTLISMKPEDSTDPFTGIILAPEWAD